MIGLETVGYALNPGTRRRARRGRGRARRRRNSWFGASRRHARAARKGWRRGHSRRRRHRMSNPRRRHRTRGRRRGRRRRNPVDAFALGGNPGRRRRRRRSRARRSNPRRRYYGRRRRRNPGGGSMSVAGLKMGFPSVVPALHLPLPGIIGKIANGIVQGVLGGGIVFGGYIGSGALVDFMFNPEQASAARAAGDKFKGYWARPLLFAGTAAVLGGVAAAVAPKQKKLLWSILAAAGPAFRAFAGVVFALLGDEAKAGESNMLTMVRQHAFALSDYIQTGELFQAGMGDDDDSMEDYIQTGSDDGTEEIADLYEAGMGDDQEVVGI